MRPFVFASGVVLIALSLASCFERGVERSSAIVPPDPKKRLQGLVSNVSSCVSREAQAPSLKKVDIETAAKAVLVQCGAPMEEYRVFMSGNYNGSPSQFGTWWRAKEAETLNFTKKIVA